MMIQAKALIVALAFCVLAGPLAAEAQQATSRHRIGWLTPVVVEDHPRAFRDAMHRLGYVEGQTMTFEERSADDDLNRLPSLAAELGDSIADCQ